MVERSDLPKILWITPEKQGGISSYSKMLFEELSREGGSFHWLNPLYPDLSKEKEILENIQEISSLQPDVIHLQHEYGLFGSKLPFFYQFPKWVKALREHLPQVQLVVTGHTVLSPNYRYPVKGRGWQIPARVFFNRIAPLGLQQFWTRSTWSLCDVVVVHSEKQKEWLQSLGVKEVVVIPHFVAPLTPSHEPASSSLIRSLDRFPELPRVVVFGYFTHDKAQDIAIEALRESLEKNRSKFLLVLAGGVRRDQDQSYFDYCQNQIQKLGLSDYVTTTGYLSAQDLNSLYESAGLVLAPFRETHGSGSLAQALARGKPILVSDLIVNQEVNERVPGAVSFFRSEDPNSCSAEIDRLLSDPSLGKSLSERALEYSQNYSLSKMSEKHLQLYQRLAQTSKN